MNVQRERPQWLTEHRRKLAAMADQFGVEMAGCPIEVLRTVVEQHDVAYAVWNDETASDGIGLLAIKGAQTIWDNSLSGQPRALTYTAFPCRGEIEAGTLREAIGDAELSLGEAQVRH